MDHGVISSGERDKIVEVLNSLVSQHLEENCQASYGVFIDLFLKHYPLETLIERRYEDVFWCSFALWRQLGNVPTGHASVQVNNPALEHDKWTCNKTIIIAHQKDMPFLVDSMRTVLNRMACTVNVAKSTVLYVKRSGDQIEEIYSGAEPAKEGFSKEALIYAEINLHADEKSRENLLAALQTVFEEVARVVEDYHPMLEKINEANHGLSRVKDLGEEQDFLSWLQQSHFTFMGFREFDCLEENGEVCLVEQEEKRLGLFREMDFEPSRVHPKHFSRGMEHFVNGPDSLAFSKSATRANVHRSIYPDYVVVKKFNEAGKYCGEYRFLGMFTYAVYSLSPWQIPIVREKVKSIVSASGLDPASHMGKKFRRVIENYPRDELIQGSVELLKDHIQTVVDIDERHVIKLLMRDDDFGHFVNCLVYVPRDLYNTNVRERIQKLIGDVLDTHDLDFNTFFSESTLARAHLVFRLKPGVEANYDVAALEAEISNIVRDWGDHLQSSLIESFGESKGYSYYNRFRKAFSSSYQEYFDTRYAVNDIRMISRLDEGQQLIMHFYQPVNVAPNILRFRILRRGSSLHLSDIIPLLENLGLRVLSEHPFKIQEDGKELIWLHDYELSHSLSEAINVDAVREDFEEACQKIWHGQSENDPFNKLILAAQLDWQEVLMLRAYARYMKQTAFPASHHFIAETLVRYGDIAKKLVTYFHLRFDPEQQQNQGDSQALHEELLAALEAISNLSEDKVLRRYIELMDATLRTNYYQQRSDEEAHESLTFKFNPKALSDIPRPRPQFEIFVYSPRIEGVHLRGGKVARGGLRWSDRIQDYRTEVLGLVKAQQVKNAVIVPEGAKGGFVAKRLHADMNRDERMKEGIACYQIFIRGLLGITDNLVNGEVVPPEGVVRHDEDDPYLVVAADKGTATFSDIANAISLEKGHWLGDAFASGGSQGYDHKGMGITAKGAWVSVQRHFREQGIDIQKEDFTVIGIGDMAGDVFGNGMLLSEHIRLTAAFNHLHIFIDPNPDAAATFKERQRLFTTPGTSWEDYDKNLISKGGGVFSRQAKYLEINKEMQAAFAIEATRLTPNELINALLKAPVDLLWNGGIGTYIKAKSESHADVGDKANDSLRVNGEELRCKVLGEGGNLGATQLGRVEFALNGGSCNTDFIDNAAGVDCSDHEVNIKILLDQLVANGDLTDKQRNNLLADMTDEVSELVLDNNYMQTQALSVAEFQAYTRSNELRRFISFLESEGRLDRKLEFLPGDDVLLERHGHQKSLTRPELSVLISYAKVMLKAEFSKTDIADDKYILKDIETAFPSRLRAEYPAEMNDHRLKKEIVATQVANSLINNLGITAGHRLLETTGAPLSEIAKAFVVSRDVFKMEEFNDFIKQQDNIMPAEFQSELLGNMMRRVRRGTRWFLRNRRGGINAAKEVGVFREELDRINDVVADVVEGNSRESWLLQKERLLERGVPETWAARLATPDNLFSGLGVVEAAKVAGVRTESIAEIFFLILERLNLSWFAGQLSDVKVETYWQAIARESFIDDLEAQLRKLTVAILEMAGDDGWHATLDAWEEKHHYLVNRWKNMVTEVQGSSVTDYAMFSVALRELIDLAQASAHQSPS